MLNQVVLIGRITKDLELKRLNDGTALTTFSIAVNRDFKNQNGEYQTDFINCVAWRNQAEFMATYLKKGYQICVVGSLQQRQYEDANGIKRTTYDVVVNRVDNLQPKETNQIENQVENKPVNASIYDDDLPF
mgnify:CR=1 FL=1